MCSYGYGSCLSLSLSASSSVSLFLLTVTWLVSPVGLYFSLSSSLMPASCSCTPPLVGSVQTFTGVVISEGTGPMSVHVHPCWGLRPGKSTPERRPRVTDHRFLVGEGPVLLSDSEDVQGSIELVHAESQHRRDDGAPRTGAGERCWVCGRYRRTRCHHSRPA